jgi:hypothetical protein
MSALQKFYQFNRLQGIKFKRNANLFYHQKNIVFKRSRGTF